LHPRKRFPTVEQAEQGTYGSTRGNLPQARTNFPLRQIHVCLTGRRHVRCRSALAGLNCRCALSAPTRGGFFDDAATTVLGAGSDGGVFGHWLLQWLGTNQVGQFGAALLPAATVLRLGRRAGLQSRRAGLLQRPLTVPLPKFVVQPSGGESPRRQPEGGTTNSALLLGKSRSSSAPAC
jgi:hypothetical protein